MTHGAACAAGRRSIAPCHGANRPPGIVRPGDRNTRNCPLRPACSMSGRARAPRGSPLPLGEVDVMQLAAAACQKATILDDRRAALDHIVDGVFPHLLSI